MKFAICNEMFSGSAWPPERVFEFIAACGYDGVEIAPFTIHEDVTKITPETTAGLRKSAEQAGIQIAGLHWLLSGTEGFHLTSSDPAVRQRTADYLAAMAIWCRDLGGGVMVFGSPAQRNLPEGMNVGDGFRNAAETLQIVAPVLEQTQVTLAIEPLGTRETNFVLTADDGIRLVEMVGSPRVRLMLDCKAMWAMEQDPVADVIRKMRGQFVHFHANDPGLGGPGFGDLDFAPILGALRETGFDRWVSVEPFDYSPGPETIAIESLKYLQRSLAMSDSG